MNNLKFSCVCPVINRAAMGRARFLPVVYLFFVMSVTRPKLPLAQMLNHAICNIYWPKLID